MHQFIKTLSLHSINELLGHQSLPEIDSNLQEQESNSILMKHAQNVILPVLPTEGYCLILKRKTKYCKLSISKDKNELGVIIEDHKHYHIHTHKQETQSHFKHHHPYLNDLKSLEYRFKNDNCKINEVAFYSRDGEYII